jgi:WD40 repeat protein
MYGDAREAGVGQAVPVKHFDLINGEANDAVLDYSGQYLACAGSKGIVVYETKTWGLVGTLDNCHSNSVTALAFGPDATFLASASKDRSLKFFA